MKIKVVKKAERRNDPTYCPFMIDIPPDVTK